MIQFFEHNQGCKVILGYPLEEDDVNSLRNLFEENYNHWSIEFGRIYSINTPMINILYKEIFEKKKNISILAHTLKLNRYLSKLGFRTTFSSSIKDVVVNISSVRVVLIGGSADSSQKIIDIVQDIRLENLALVVAQHIEAKKIGKFDEILQQYTNCKVSYAEAGKKIESKKIYLAPNNRHLKVENGYFKLSSEDKYNFARPSISISYESFSNYYKDSLLVIQECGYAADGVDKLALLRSNHTTIVLQDKDECEAKPMIVNALATHKHNYIFNQKEIVSYINFVGEEGEFSYWVEYLLEMIKERYSYDFKLYNRDMVTRRLESFMIKHSIKEVQNAVGIILFNKRAFKAFFLEVSINVTEFFRNPQSYKNIAKFLVENYKRNYSIKLWSAGCSSGKEAYSMAIVLQNLGMLDKSIIYATDFNGVVIDEAKNAIYSNEAYMTGLKNFDKIGLNDNFNRYIAKNNNFITIDEKIRKKTLFFQHNLVEDSSFNEFDIIICENVLIYFNEELQEKVFKLFYDSLKFGGFLVLGKSEVLHPSFSNKFDKYLQDCKIYKKVA